MSNMIVQKSSIVGMLSGLAAGLMLWTSVAAAAMPPIPGEDRFEALQDPADSESLTASLGLAKIDGDYFMAVQPRFELNMGGLGLGLQIPLNLRVWDKEPKNTGDFGGYIRKEDWDETKDFLKVLRHVRLGHKRGDFYARVGELAAELGHGTIMDRYLNNLDISNFRVGAQFDINTNYGGFETVINDIGTAMDKKSVDSRIVGGRLFIKPLALFMPDSFLNIFSIGVSYVSDLNAPLTLATECVEGDVNCDSTDINDPARQVVINSQGKFESQDTTAASVLGFDIEADVLSNALIDVTPYIDYNTISKAGSGLHLGVRAKLKMPILIDLTIPIRAEYRIFDENYAPAYFSTFYEIERYGIGGALPKVKALRAMPKKKGIKGYYADAAFDFLSLAQVGAVYEDYEGGDPNLAIYLAVPALEVVQFKAYYARTAITGTDDIFKLDDRSYAIAQARYQMYPFLYLAARGTRQWALVTEGSDRGIYKSSDSFDFGIEFAMDL